MSEGLSSVDLKSSLGLDRRRLLMSAGALALPLGACATTAGVTPAPALPATQAMLDALVAEGRIPGVAIGVRHAGGPPIFLQSGRLAFEDSAPMRRDSLFRIYSMTKPVTGAATALLIEAGRLGLDQPVADFVPEFAALRVATDPENSLDSRPIRTPMTVRHLLTHSAGFGYHILGDGPVQRAYRRAGLFPITGYNRGATPEDGAKVRDLDELVARLAEIPLLFEPGSAYGYSLAQDVLGLVIQRASGMAFPDFVQRGLLDPLGMRDTVWRLRPGDGARLASLYDVSGAEPSLVESGRASAYADPVTLYAGGAGLVSSAPDYLAFLNMLLNDGRHGGVRIMQPQTARLMRSDILPAEVSAGNGLGHGFGGTYRRVADPRPGGETVGAFGWSGAAGTLGWIDPTRRLAVTAMIQAFPLGAVRLNGPLRAALSQDLGLDPTA